MPRPRPPEIVAAADWSAAARKRWLAVACLEEDGGYLLQAPEPAGESGALLLGLRERAGRVGTALVGFDFPIGLPRAYALRAGLASFREALERFGSGDWARFYEVTDRPGLRQPFGPVSNSRNGMRRDRLAAALGLAAEDDLFRLCDHRTAQRPRAEAVFFTRFAKQVGRATVHGWREVLQPAAGRVRLWPFDGSLGALLAMPGVVVAEIYPAEAAAHLGLGIGSGSGRGKGKPEHRRDAASALRLALRQAGVRLTEEAERQVTNGFASDDAFDAFLGLASLLHVVLGRRPASCPDDPSVQRVEGWILGLLPGDVAGTRGSGPDNTSAAAGDEAQEGLLLERIHAQEALLRALLAKCGDRWPDEDPFRRFYRSSPEVFALQPLTAEIAGALLALTPGRPLHPRFVEIVRAGTGQAWSPADDTRCAEAARPVLEAYLHARFFLEAAVRCAHLEVPPRPLPSGYAALLDLLGLR